MGRRIEYAPSLKKHIRRYNLREKVRSISRLLGKDAQKVFDWAKDEAKKRLEEEGKETTDANLGRMIYQLIGEEAAIRLVQQNHERGRMTTKSEVKKKTGQKLEMPVLYRRAGYRHPQEARNLRHNMFHEAFVELIMDIFPDVETSVPSTGEGLTPDLMVTHKSPDWTISVEYKGYRSLTLLSESEVLKAMRYADAYGTAWLVTTTNKSVEHVYSGVLDSEEIIQQGLERLDRIVRRRTYTDEQRENRGIARKGMKHLEKQRGTNLKCDLLEINNLLESCKNGSPLEGLAITTGLEFVEMLKEHGLDKRADDILQVMKRPTHSLHSDTVTSIRLID